MLSAACILGSARGAAALAEPELRLLEMVNAERESAGRHPLEANKRLSRRAERNSRTMARTREASHSGGLRSGMAENIGMGPTLRSIVRGWMRSGPHKRNMLGSYRVAGVGVDKGGGLFWVTLILH